MCVLKTFNFSYKGAPGGVLSKKEHSYPSFLDIVPENSNQKVMLAILKESYGICTVMLSQCYTPSKERRRFLYFNHLSKEFLEQMIPHLKALI